MNNSEFTCDKCRHKMPMQNRMLHEAQCNGLRYNSQSNLNNFSRHESNLNINQNINTNQNFNSSQNAFNNNLNQIPFNNSNSNNNSNYTRASSQQYFVKCGICSLSMPSDQIQDHKYSHEIERNNLSRSSSNINFGGNINEFREPIRHQGSNVSISKIIK